MRSLCAGRGFLRILRKKGVPCGSGVYSQRRRRESGSGTGRESVCDPAGGSVHEENPAGPGGRWNYKEAGLQKTVPLTASSPRNAGQYFLQEALMQPADKAPLVIVKGMAGTSKTFYSLAVGLEKLLNHPTGEYRRILVCRPNAQFDDDIGFLPGDEQEKISPLMRPVIDNLEQLIDSSEEERYQMRKCCRGNWTRFLSVGSSRRRP